MFKITAIGLGGLWFLGFITAHTLGGWIHIILLAAMILMTMKIYQDRKKPVLVMLSLRRPNCIKSFPYHSKTRE